MNFVLSFICWWDSQHACGCMWRVTVKDKATGMNRSGQLGWTTLSSKRLFKPTRLSWRGCWSAGGFSFRFTSRGCNFQWQHWHFLSQNFGAQQKKFKDQWIVQFSVNMVHMFLLDPGVLLFSNNPITHVLFIRELQCVCKRKLENWVYCIDYLVVFCECRKYNF